MSLGLIAPASAVVVSDNFDTAHDYQFGAVPAGGIWTNVENVLNLSGGAMNASVSNAGTLTVDDNGTFDADGDPGNGISGMGWEGLRSTSPFLHAPVPAGQDFTATVKISAQTSGQWSTAGIVARAANSPTPPGIGADHADENFVTMTSFRTDAAIPDEGNTLMKRIEAGAQVADVNIVVNAAGTEPLPLYVRLERMGLTGYRGWVSQDGGATYQLQSHFIPAVGNALRDSTVPMEVGLAYHNFGTLAGTAQFDDFVLDIHDPLPAPGAPVLSSAQAVFSGAPGTVFEQLITDSTGQGLLAWTSARIGPPRPVQPPANFTQTLTPGAQGPLLAGQGSTSMFRWDTVNWNPGVYTFTITARNDWDQFATHTLTITLIPEPSTVGLVLIAGFGASGLRRRRR